MSNKNTSSTTINFNGLTFVLIFKGFVRPPLLRFQAAPTDPHAPSIEVVSVDVPPEPELITYSTPDLAFCVRAGQRDSRLYWLKGDTEKMEAAIKKLMSYFLIQNGPAMCSSLILHASAVERDGKALLFMAPSEGGKSTISRMLEARGFSKFADDLVQLRRQEEHFLANDFFDFYYDLSQKKPVSCRLNGIYFIEKSKENLLTHINYNDRVARMVQQLDFPYRMADLKKIRQKDLEFIFDIAKHVPCQIFRFARDTIFKKDFLDSLFFDKSKMLQNSCQRLQS
ncbi:MAG: hypothetical protein ABIJ26_00855 [Candidatus Margulisiibacteriota bacterium]|nr:hypothetical protein [Candidatus Margulisiibacteriota bacterium]